MIAQEVGPGRAGVPKKWCFFFFWGGGGGVAVRVTIRVLQGSVGVGFRATVFGEYDVDHRCTTVALW